MTGAGRDAYLSDAAWDEASQGDYQPGKGHDLDLPALRYQSGALLGRGGNASVRAGFDPILQRHVALKRAHRSDTRASELLLREARLTARLDHPAIAEVLDLGLEGDEVVMVLHVRHGRGLAEAVASALPKTTLLRALAQACHAVAHAHRRGIIHRDLSPGNVSIGEAGEVTVLDWGLAAELAEGARGGVTGGTPGFAAPELRQGQPTTPATDVWSLGALLYLVSSGTTPKEELRQPRHCDRRLWAILQRALASLPAQRYHDAQEFAADLDAYLDGRAVSAYREQPWDRLLRQIKHHPAAAAAFSAVLIVASLAVGLGGVLAARSESRARLAEEQARSARTARLVDAAERALEADDTGLARSLAGEAQPGPEQIRARGVLAAVARAAPLVLRPATTACAADRLVDAQSADGWAVCRWASGFELRKGPLRTALPGNATSGTVLTGNRVWVATNDALGSAVLRAVQGASGAWEFSTTVVQGGLPTLRSSHSRQNGAVFTASGVAAIGPQLGNWLSPCTPGFAPRDVAVQDDGVVLIWCGDENIYSIHNGIEVAKVHAEVLPALRGVTRFDSLGGGLAVVGTVSGRVGIVDLKSGQVVTAQDTPVGMVRSLAAAVGPDGPRVLVAGSHGATLYLPRQNRLVPLESATGPVALSPTEVVRQAAAEHDDGLRLVSTRAESGAATSGSWRLGPTPAHFSSLSGLHGRSALAVPATGAALAIGDGNGRVEWFDFATGRSQALAGPHRVVKSLAWTPDGRFLAVGGAGPEGLAVLTAATGQPLQGPWVGEVDLRGRHLGWLGADLLVAMAWGGGPYVWRVRSDGTVLVAIPPLSGHDPKGLVDAKDLASAKNGVWILYASGLLIRLEKDGESVRQRPVGQVPGGKVLALTESGDRAAVVSGETVVLLNGRGEVVERLQRPGALIDDAALADDGRLALCRRDGTVSLESGGGAQIWTVPAHTDRCAAIVFCDRDQALCSAGWDGRVRVFAAASVPSP